MDSTRQIHAYPETCHAAIASLVADWFWELDASLRYVYHDGDKVPPSVKSHSELIGLNRIEHLESDLLPSEELAEHNRLLEAHEPVDMVLPVARVEGELIYNSVVARPVFDKQGVFKGYFGCGSDVTERVRMRERLAYLANHDELTGIFNRREFQSRLSLLHSYVQHTKHEFTLGVLDLDRFKLVNDTAGHAAGDKLLQELVEIISQQLNSCETVARLGGDEFGLLFESSASEARIRAQSIIDAIAAHVFTWEGRQYWVGACIGLTPIQHGEDDVEVISDRADSACYAAKRNGRNQCRVFARDSQDYLEYRKELKQVDMIKRALQANRLRLFMQPIQPSDARSHVPFYEILLRLESESGELLSPDTFIPVAERFLIMQDLDQWVLQHCLNTIDTFRTAGSEISLSINLSGNTLSDLSALQRIIDTVRETDVPGSLLCFEITETAAIGNIDNVVDFMHQLKAEDVKFALDDFGAGLSSFAYIRSLPIDYLKIDGYFIRNIRSDSTNRAITAAFIKLSRELGIATVAESVEDKATRTAVREMGIDFVQGYGIARPTAVDDEIIALLSNSVDRVAVYLSQITGE